MIVWIDGPYGVGKSTLAEKLQELEPHSFLFDAEEVGNAVRENTPRELFCGYIFENYPLWFDFCVELLKDISRRYDGTIYVPMTLILPDSFGKFARPLRRAGIEIEHILLESSHEIVRDRILQRGEDEGCWCMEQIDLCLERQRRFENVIRIPSFGQSPEELAAVVQAALVGGAKA